MFQQDYLLNEARKFAQLLAKLMGLKTEGNNEEYIQQFNSELKDEYNIELEKLLSLNDDEFIASLNSSAYSAEKLNALGQMLYVFAEPFEAGMETDLILRKVLIIFDLLEQIHHYQSFENIDKRNIIYKYFNKIHDQS
jgi:hypothetical protein